MQWIFLTLVSVLAFLEGSELPSKLYCFYTPQFEELFEKFFSPSLKDDFELVVRKFAQESPSGLFKSEGWDKTMYRKLQMLREAVLEHWDGRVFFYSDVDIIFFKPVIEVALNYLEECDFVIQQGWPNEGLCAGFIVMRGSHRTLRWIDLAMGLMEKGICTDDQTALRMALEKIPKEELLWKFLPSLEFPNGKRVLKGYQKDETHLYAKDAPLDLDDSILLFHANCCIGLENKMYFLRRVEGEHNKKFKKWLE